MIDGAEFSAEHQTEGLNCPPPTGVGETIGLEARMTQAVERLFRRYSIKEVADKFGVSCVAIRKTFRRVLREMPRGPHKRVISFGDIANFVDAATMTRRGAECSTRRLRFGNVLLMERTSFNAKFIHTPDLTDNDQVYEFDRATIKTRWLFMRKAFACELPPGHFEKLSKGEQEVLILVTRDSRGYVTTSVMTVPKLVLRSRDEYLTLTVFHFICRTYGLMAGTALTIYANPYEENSDFAYEDKRESHEGNVAETNWVGCFAQAD